jgi:hypothetical protein
MVRDKGKAGEGEREHERSGVKKDKKGKSRVKGQRNMEMQE